MFYFTAVQRRVPHFATGINNDVARSAQNPPLQDRPGLADTVRFGAAHIGGCQFVLCDASVRNVGYNIPVATSAPRVTQPTLPRTSSTDRVRSKRTPPGRAATRRRSLGGPLFAPVRPHTVSFPITQLSSRTRSD